MKHATHGKSCRHMNEDTDTSHCFRTEKKFPKKKLHHLQMSVRKKYSR